MFSTKLSGAPLGAPWDTADWDADPDWDFNLVANDPPEQLYALRDGTGLLVGVRLTDAAEHFGRKALAHVGKPEIIRFR